MTEINDNNYDDSVDAIIATCLTLDAPKSFFTFAGAGSGKTRSLERALTSVMTRYREYLRMHGKFVGVITYTKAASNEITRRVNFDALVKVSTIHSFIWELVRGFDDDIRGVLADMLKSDIAKLQDEQSRSKDLRNKTSVERAEKIKSKNRRIDRLQEVKRFVYSPDEGKPSRGSLNHSEVIEIGSRFISDNGVMQQILINRFPILLIDESQDTNAKLMEAFMKVQSLYPNSFVLGLFGDMMQRIYNDGKADLGQNLPADWAKPLKAMNHRCPPRVVDLINKVRMTTDRQQQRPRTDKATGFVRLFLLPHTTQKKDDAEKEVARQMAVITGDLSWEGDGANVKRLILEHHMASSRMGFTQMFRPLYEVDDLKTGALDGTLPGVTFFTNCIQPLVDGRLGGDEFTVANVVRSQSPLLSRKALLKAGKDRVQNLDRANDAVDSLCALWDGGRSPTFGEIVKSIAGTGLFTIPECFRFYTDTPVAEPAADSGDGEPPIVEEENDSDALKVDRAWEQFLAANFSQLKPYSLYVSGVGGFGTHQGVKGLEFPRVMVIMDDEEARGNSFSYDRLFGAKDPSSSEIKAVKEGRESGVDKTKRLFYVTCSRAQSSLALVAYSANCEAVKRELIKNQWFTEAEIIILRI